MSDASDHRNRFVVLISHERSGSHYLADLLASGGVLTSVDEVCNFQATNPSTAEASFFRFRRQAMIANADFALRPNAEGMHRFLDSYLSHLDGLVGVEGRVLVDIKYGHVHNFEIGWWPSERRPFLLYHLETRGIPVIHLRRRDSLAAVVSGQIADRTRVWHRREGDPALDAAKVRLPALKAVHEALALEREKDNFADWLAGNRVFDIEYEMLAATRDPVLQSVCDFLGHAAPHEFRSSYIKVTPPLREIVENHEELAKVVRMFGAGRLRLD